MNAASISKLIENPGGKEILPLLKYEAPDLILESLDESQTGDPVLVLEFMTHTPQWQHPMQRFARIYGGAFCGIPSGMVLPRSKTKFERKGGDDYVEVVYKCSPSVYSVFLRLSKLSGTPSCIYHWPDRDGHLKIDSMRPNSPRVEGDISLMLTLTGDLLDAVEAGHSAETRRTALAQNGTVAQTLAGMKGLAGVPDAATFGTVEGIKSSEDVLKLLKNPRPPPWSRWGQRNECVVFAPEGLHPPKAKFRTDPYAGMLCAFDILFCRDPQGKRNRNLVFRARDVRKSYAKGFSHDPADETAHEGNPCPFRDLRTAREMTREDIKQHIRQWCPFASSKHRRIYGQVSDLILFDDGYFWGGGGR